MGNTFKKMRGISDKLLGDVLQDHAHGFHQHVRWTAKLDRRVRRLEWVLALFLVVDALYHILGR